MSALSHEQARRVYDRIGALLDSQSFYEDCATDVLVRNGRFGSAQRVFELGCGTGRFAKGLLASELPPAARYRGLDLSPTMVRLARERLAPFGSRAEVALTDGSPPKDEPGASCDRFISNFVLDLLSEDDISAVIGEAHRILEPGGLLCLTSLAIGADSLSRVVARGWAFVHAWSPALTGGCRPLDLRAHVPEDRFPVMHHAALSRFGVPSEVVIAERR